ncbi:hypothetical protein Tco_0485286, partial [Tanacetum coccineum]
YDHDISSDDDSYENIEYVEASPLNLEYDSLEEENEDQEEKEFDLEDIFQIQDVILCEKLLNVHRLITNIKSLKNNSTPDHVFKFPSLVLIFVTDSGSFFEESDTFLSYSDNSLPEFETFSNHTEETRSGSTTTQANNSLPEYDSFLFEIEPNQGGLTSIVIFDNSNEPLLELPEFESFHFDLDPSFPRPPPEPPDVEISLIVEIDAPVINNFDELNEDECFDPGEVRLMLKMTIPSHLLLGFVFHFSPTLRFLLYFPSPKMRTPFLTPASPLKTGGLSSGWNFHVLKCLSKHSCADIVKITRKRLKPGKHEHGNGRARKEPGESYQKSKVINSTSDKELEAPMEDQLLPADASPIALSPGYIADSDPEEDEEDSEEDPADYPTDGGDNDDNESSDDDNDDDDVEKDEEDKEEEEHLALADPSAVPTDDPIPSS